MTAQHEPANAVYAFVEAFVDELARSGVGNVVICPGSRSAPLAMSFAAHAGIHTWMHIDERSAAFFALGMAKRGRQPVALLCTSGTAAANFFPAIIEAKLAHVPLLVLTADRPPELRDNGAPQAIDQNRLYGSYPKWFVDVALPEATNAALHYIRTLADRAVALTSAAPAGPVHLNFPFREPLTPDPITGQILPPPEQRDPIAWYGRPGNAPYITVSETLLAASSDTAIRRTAEQLRSAPHGLIIAGPQDEPALAGPLVSLAEYLGYPILADPLSQVRCGPHNRDLVLSSYDAFLRDEMFVTRAEPQIILRFGAMPTSKPVLLYLQRYPACPQIVIDGNTGWEEPTQLASMLIHTDPVAFCRVLEEHIRQPEEDIYQEEGTTWLRLWQQADHATRIALDTAIRDFPPFFEGRVFSELYELLPEGTALYVGNSMSVRDMDTFFWSSERRLHILGNRGANGIDGVTSSALGASAAAPEQPTVLVVGDLSFLHDLNGLLAARLHGLHLTIVLINNDGGGIFSFLPQAAYQQRFEQLFGTPTGLDLRPAVEMYGGRFERAESWEQFRAAVQNSIAGTGLRVIEVRSERESNVLMHRQLWQVVTRALQKVSDDEDQ